MHTRKQLDYLDFKKFLELKISKAYFTKDGYDEMYKLSSSMNSGRGGIKRVG